jgi:hypothetical protein
MIKSLLIAFLVAILAGFASLGTTYAHTLPPTPPNRLSLRPPKVYPSPGPAHPVTSSLATANSPCTVLPGQSAPTSITHTLLSKTACAKKLVHVPSPLDTQSPHKVEMSLVGDHQVSLTNPIMLSGSLNDLSMGDSVANKTIVISTHGDYLGQTHTDEQGNFTMQITKDLPAGIYQLIASFKGDHLLAPASTSIYVEVLPVTFQVQTIPAVSGITFQIDGRKFVSDDKGTASIQLYHTGDYQLSVLLDLYHNPSQQVKFGRWSDENYQPEHDIQIPGDSAIQVGFNIYHQVSMDFVDLDGLPVDVSHISAISIRSVQGDVFTLKPGDKVWLPASRTARRQTGLEVTDLLYSVNSVIINGSNVVNSAQQRFYVKPDDLWSISLLLYSMHITARDSLFASPIGQSVNIILPDGQVVNHPLNTSGSLDVESLPRGIYHISLPGVTGLGTSTPVALSRNQAVNLRVVTALDLAIIGFLSIGLALGLIFYGRPWLLDFIFKRKHSSSGETSHVNP